jgi:glycerophosphoryl diester phosphodiesterase
MHQKKATGPRAAAALAQDRPSLLLSAAFWCLLVAGPLVIAHRGASAEAPENTLRAFRRALALGADGIELDVQLTHDGVPVVFHDATLTRLTGRRGRIARLPLDELRAVRIEGEPLPTLTEVLASIRRRAVVQIEIKRGVAVAPVVRAVRRAQASAEVIFASFEPALLAEARRLAPRTPRMLIAGGRRRRLGPFQIRMEPLAATLAMLGAAGVSLDRRTLRLPTFITALKSRGWCVWCWTVNEPSAMLRLASWGVDAILSDNPALVISTLERSDRQNRARGAPTAAL